MDTHDVEAPVLRPEPPEHAARQHLGLRENAWVWAGAGAVAAATIIAWACGAGPGALVLAGWLVVCGAVRATGRRPGPAGIAVRSRNVDVATYWALAAAVGFLALTAPMI
ncbi:MAG: DUF3017 domain-containing protein [Cellulomonadaceae bacterium]